MAEIEDLMIQIMQRSLFSKLLINESLIFGSGETQVIDFTQGMFIAVSIYIKVNRISRVKESGWSLESKALIR